jgi:dynein heavy chain
MSTPEHYDKADSFIRLWVHEVHRVFCDPLVDDGDQLRFLNIVRETTTKRFGVDFDRVFEHLDLNGDGKVNTVKEIRNLFFGDYIGRKHTSSASSSHQQRPYVEIDDPLRLQLVWKNYLTDYNALSNKPMNLVMFRFAIEHVSRIVRILKQESGNALLIGVGGSGKQSLTRLAASVMEYDVIQIELTRSYARDDWCNDLKKLLKKAGGEGKPTVFLFSDSQMLSDESFLEDINSLLNSGQVPALWNSEEKAEVVEMVRSHAKRLKRAVDGTPEQLWMFFEERVRENLHVVLCMSPIGDAFKER